MCSVCNLLPAEAIQTAEFVSDVNDLFDSLNGTLRFPKDQQKKIHCRISKQSNHILFWDNMVSKINSWQFESEKYRKKT